MRHLVSTSRPVAYLLFFRNINVNLNAVLLVHAENIIESYVQWKNKWIPMLQYEYHGRKWSDVTTCQVISWYDKQVRPEHSWPNKVRAISMSTLVQVMACCRQASGHYLSQCWSKCMKPNSVTRPQWVNNIRVFFKIKMMHAFVTPAWFG